MEKIDLKEEYKELYKMKAGEIRKVQVPKQNIISVLGKGDPNGKDFEKAIGKIFSVAYTAKFDSKKRGEDFVVMPLEAYWWSDNMEDFVKGNKDNWQWEVFIVLPDFVSEEDIERAKVEVVRKKKRKNKKK